MFTVLLPLVPGRRAALEAHLRSGSAESLFGLSAVEALHFASFTIHDDPRSGSKLILELNGEGTAAALLRSLVGHCGTALQPVLAACQGWPGAASSLDVTVSFLRAQVQWPSARHVGNTGRSVAQIREQAMLHERIGSTLDSLQASGTTFASPADARNRLQAEVDPHRGTPSPRPRLTRGERLRRLVGPIIGALTVPIALVFVWLSAG